MLVVNTPKGLFQFTRLPYGVSTAPAIFQSVMDRILQGLPVACYLDDILIAGKSKEEHDHRLAQVLQRLAQSGVHLQKEKCSFNQTEVEYLGHRVDTTGIHPTEKKVQAIKEAPVPADTTQLRAFIGLMNYYGKFIPQISTHLSPLYKLLEKEQTWAWSKECETTFCKCQALLTSDTVLVHYDSKLPIKLACDASAYGVGAVLSHVFKDGERPIAFASRTLTKAERNYGQIEKEALALFFGVKKFHKYIYGRTFTLVTDHKPLLSILGPKAEIPPIAAARMQRWGIFLSAYQYDVEYKRSKEHANADGLSRLPLSYQLDDKTDIFRVSFVDALPVTAVEIASETTKDPLLSQVYHYVMDGWPSQGVEEVMRPLYQRREQLSTDQGCLLWGMRVIVPAKLQPRILSELHFTHPGIVKMKLLARSYVWWYKIDQDIEEVVRTCENCAVQRSLPPKAPLHSWPWANRPMQRIHIDYAEIEGCQVLVIIDIHSKWIEAIPLRNATAATTIEALRKFFANFGLPEEIISDNGPQFVATEFETFCKQNGIKNIHTPPYHPASNGAAERAVQVVKQAMKKMGTALPLSTRLARFLLMYHTTPHATTEMRPDELFLHRHLRTRLTLTQPDLSPIVEKHQQQQKKSHDKKNPLVTFAKQEPVLVRNQRGKKAWLRGTIIKQKGPVTYLVQIGTQIRFCHVDHLLKTGTKATAVIEEEEEISDWLSPSASDDQGREHDEVVSEEQAVDVSSSATTGARHSSRIRQPTKCWIEEM